MRVVAAASLAKGHVRPIVEDDLGSIAALHREVFGPGTSSQAELRSFLLDLFFGHPWPDERLPSLLYEEAGDIVGCLGVMPRPMSIDGRPVLAALSHNFMVAPQRRSTMAALEMLRAFFAGPQTLSFAEGNEASRRLWSAMGGTTSIAYSFRFTLPLRPARFAISRLAGRGLPAPLASALRPPAAAIDQAAARLVRSPFRRPKPDPRIAAEPLDAATLAECIDRASRRRSLRPRYDVASLERMLDITDRRPDQGPLRRVLLRKDERIVGWYLFFPERPTCAAVLQVGFAEDAAPEVLDHLFHDAWAHGACAITGLLEPGLLPALSERPCLFHRGAGDRWLLVHSRDERVQRALHTGDAFYTHLEGEWWA